MRATGNGRLIVSMACFIAVLVLLAPGVALADDLSDATGSTEGVVEDTVEDVTEVVTEVVNEVSEAAEDGTDEVTAAVDDVVDEVNDATNTATNDVTQADGIAGAVEGSSGSDSGGNPAAHGGGGSRTGERERAGFLVTISRAGDPGSRRWEPVNPLGVGLTGTSSGVLLQTGESDPCEDLRSVCLGLLFGQGEFVRLGPNVLGVLATTGIGVIGLMVIALALGVGGSGALVAARDRSSFARPAG